MKRNLTYMMMLALMVVSLTGCDSDSTAGMTRITYYPDITVLGDATTYVTLGSTYTDAGCQVLLNGEDVTADATTTSDVDTTTPGIYTVTYTAMNEDGFSMSASRSVYVINPGHFDTVYWGESQYGTRHYYDAPIVITSLSNGNYEIDDAVGGFYFNGRYPGYEPTYDFHAEAELTLNADNSITLVSVGSWYFGSTELILTSGSFDPETGDVELIYDFGGATMSVYLTQVTLN